MNRFTLFQHVKVDVCSGFNGGDIFMPMAIIVMQKESLTPHFL
jgi:hypothetical protein